MCFFLYYLFQLKYICTLSKFCFIPRLLGLYLSIVSFSKIKFSFMSFEPDLK
ncbi:hypothetical protein RLOC_00001336, partial [Lonchura striata]